MEEFEAWWRNEGSALRPQPGEDLEEFAHRVTRTAWGNGEFTALRKCAENMQTKRTVETTLSQRDT